MTRTRTHTRRPRRPAFLAFAAALAATLALTAGACGNKDDGSDGSPAKPGASSSAVDDAAQGNGDWLLRFTTAEGADGERSRSVFVTFNPATGAAHARSLPATTGGNASPDEEVLLVSADHAWAVRDTGVPRREALSGKLVLYSVADASTRTLDLPAATGVPGVQAKAWAFDPTDAQVLRVVDTDLRVWKVDLATSKATAEAPLQTKDGWIFADGFDKTTGEPYIESIDSDETLPAGNGDSDTRPVQRQGGTLVRYDGATLEGLPKPPCGFAGGFEFDGGLAWLFCADTPSITAYQAHADGASWHAFGTPSPKIVPKVAAEFSFVLPPVR